jgi:hypothetical protein
MRLYNFAAYGALAEQYVGMAHMWVMRPRHDRRPMFSGSELSSLDDQSMVHVAVRQSLPQSKVTPGRAVTEPTIPSNGAAANATALRNRAQWHPAHAQMVDGEVQSERWEGRDRRRTALGVVAFLACSRHVALAVARPLARVCDKKGHDRKRVE